MLFNESSITKIAICGPSGVGKTELVLELAYKTRQEDKRCSVFWVSVSDSGSLDQGFKNIARRLEIPEKNEEADFKSLVRHRLSSTDVGRWLLVIDGVPDDGNGLLEVRDDLLAFASLPTRRHRFHDQGETDSRKIGTVARCGFTTF